MPTTRIALTDLMSSTTEAPATSSTAAAEGEGTTIAGVTLSNAAIGGM